MIGLKGTRPRRRLAEWLCRRFRFLDARGRPRLFTCLNALRDPEREDHFQLPPRQLHIVSQWRARQLAGPVRGTGIGHGWWRASLVRARHDRNLADSECKLYDEIKASRNVAQMEVVIPRQRWKKAKREQAKQPCCQRERLFKGALSGSYHLIDTQRSAIGPGHGPVGVHAREETPPPGIKWIEWLLLTTQEVRTPEDAARIVAFYTRRWRIEEWQHILKSRCRVQEHQNETADRLKGVIVIDAVLA